jgi:hypothetical protein
MNSVVRTTFRFFLIALTFLVVGIFVGAVVLHLSSVIGPHFIPPDPTLSQEKETFTQTAMITGLIGGPAALLTGLIAAGMAVSGHLQKFSFVKVTSIAVVVECLYVRLATLPSDIEILSIPSVLLFAAFSFVAASVCWLLTLPLLRSS